MISYGIDGASSSSGQLLDLLTLVANPDAYKSKIQALEEATAENKKYVEAVGPAAEILQMRDAIAADKAKSASALDSAKEQAAQIVAQARQEADSLMTNTKVQAEAILADAETARTNANGVNAVAQQALKAAETAQAKAEELAAKGTAQLEQAAAEKAAVAQERVEVADLKASILAKHQAFIQSL
jgi:hypothetical protein